MTLKRKNYEISHDPIKLRIFKIISVISIFVILAIFFSMGKFTYDVSPSSYYNMSSEEKPIVKQIYVLEKEYRSIKRKSKSALSEYIDASKKATDAGQRKVTEAALHTWYKFSKEAESYEKKYSELSRQEADISRELNSLKEKLGSL